LSSIRHSYTITTLHFSTTPLFLFMNASPPSELFTLSLHDALPISTNSPMHAMTTLERVSKPLAAALAIALTLAAGVAGGFAARLDRKSTRLNSSHVSISYAVFCLKKKILHHDL